MIGIYLIVLILLFIWAFIIESKSDDTYPDSWYVDENHNFVITEPFWIKHVTDGQLMKNPLYTDNNMTLNKEGIRVLNQLKANDPYYGSNKRPNDN